MFAEGVCVRAQYLAALEWEKRVVNPGQRKIIERSKYTENKTKTRPSLFTLWIWKFHYFSGVVVTTAASIYTKKEMLSELNNKATNL